MSSSSPLILQPSTVQSSATPVAGSTDDDFWLDIADTPEAELLFALLDVPEYRWILWLLAEPLVLLTGAPGAGKTTFALSLLILRSVLLSQAGVVVSPHGHQEQQRWPYSIHGSGQDDRVIQRAVNSYYISLTRASDRHSFVWDEFTSYGERIDDAGRLFRSLATEPRKLGQTHTLIAHSDKKGVAGGNAKESGFSDLKEGALQVRLIPKRVPGLGPRPAHKAVVVGRLYDEDGRATIEHLPWPVWFEPKRLLVTCFQYDGAAERLQTLLGSTALQQMDAGDDSSPVLGTDVGSNSGAAVNESSTAANRLNQLLEKDLRDFCGASSGFNSGHSHPEMPTYTPMNLNRTGMLQLITLLQGKGATETEIIEGLWGVTKGGSKSYARARYEFKDLTTGNPEEA